jgi:hypothetical protein
MSGTMAFVAGTGRGCLELVGREPNWIEWW